MINNDNNDNINNTTKSKPILTFNSFKKSPVEKLGLAEKKIDLIHEQNKEKKQESEIDTEIKIERDGEKELINQQSTQPINDQEKNEELEQVQARMQKINSMLPVNVDQSIIQNAKKPPLISEEDYQEILLYMQEHYPKCFPALEPFVPLAVGIHHQLLATNNCPFPNGKIRKFFGRYTRSRNYRKYLVIARDRFDLNGIPTSKILEEEVNRTKWKEIKQARVSAK